MKRGIAERAIIGGVFIVFVSFFLFLVTFMSKPDYSSPQSVCSGTNHYGFSSIKTFPLLEQDRNKVISTIQNNTNRTVTKISLEKIEPQTWEMQDGELTMVRCQAFYNVCIKGSDEFIDKCYPKVIGKQLEIYTEELRQWR